MIKVGINGFGRIGRFVFRAAQTRNDIVIVGIISKTMSTTTPMTISRTMPELDYITEASNRLWGCTLNSK